MYGACLLWVKTTTPSLHLIGESRPGKLKCRAAIPQYAPAV
jgi:hypothetical protein